jgi:hypothetical protein
MGCAAAKDIAADQALNEQENGAVEGGVAAPLVNPHQDAINEYRKTLSNKRPQTLETFWVAGAVESNQSAPHYVPSRGPMSIHQKLPMHFANVRKRVVTSVVAAPSDLIPLSSQHGSGGGVEAGGNGGRTGQGPPSLGGTLNTIGEPLPIISVGSSPIMAPPAKSSTLDASSVDALAEVPAAFAASADPTHTKVDDHDELRADLTPSKPSQATVHHMASLMSLSSTGRRVLRPASSSMMLLASTANRGGATIAPGRHSQATGTGITPVVAAFPMPRWFALEQVLPSSEKVLLEAAEGKLSLFGGGTDSGSAASYHIARLPALDPLQLQHPLPPMYHHSSGAVVAGTATHTTVATTPAYALRAHYVLPDDVIIARALLAQPLQNYTVGWIKVPVAPVTFRQTLSTSRHNNADGGAHHQEQEGHDIRGLQQHDDNRNTEDAGTTTSFTGVNDEHLRGVGAPKAVQVGVGYLSPDKPVYDTAVDGPVSAPYETPMPTSENPAPPRPAHEIQQDSSVVPLPRHLEKYYLYVKHVTSLCVTMSWKVASDLDGSFADVNLQHSLTVQPPPQALDAPSAGERQQTVLTRSVMPLPSPASSNASFFMALPVIAQTSSADLDDRVHHCVPSLHQSLLLGDTSVPMYINTPTRIMFPALFDALQRLVDYESDNSSITTVVTSAAVGTPSEIECLHAAGAAAAAAVSHDEVCWLAFRLRFLEWLRGAVQTVINAHEQNPRKEPLMSAHNRLQAVHIAIRFGMKFQYDNQELLAFNEHGRSNRAAARTDASSCKPGGLFDEEHYERQHPLTTASVLSEYLTFIDRSRLPAVDTSCIVAESQTVVLSCRLVPSAPHQPASTFLPEVDGELRLLRVLFGKDALFGSRVTLQ